MKLVTFRVHTEDRLGLCTAGKVVDLNSAYTLYLKEVKGVDNAISVASTIIPSFMNGFLEGGQNSIEAARKAAGFIAEKGEKVRGLRGERIVFKENEEIRLLPPIPSPSKIYCLAVNYYSHAKEGGFSLPEKAVPVLFNKSPSAVIGPLDPIIIPKVSSCVDYEVELGVIIGKKAKNVPKEKAYDYIAGYTVFNDVSFRDQRFPEENFYKRLGVNWVKGKDMDNSAPMGPCIALKDEIENPYPLKLSLKVNGEIRQREDTSGMIIRIPEILEYISAGTTLNLGDVISTGTCAGVACFNEDLPYLSPGDVVEAEIERIGTLRNPVVAES